MNRLNQYNPNQDPYSVQRNHENQQDQTQIKGTLSATMCIIFVGFLLLNSIFIIPNLIYANQNSQCVTTKVDGFAFPLKTWLQVDAYIRIGMSALILIAAAIVYFSFSMGVLIIACITCLIIIYSLFMFGWVITGSVLFWGKLNPMGVCTGGVQVYMHIFLILTYLGICCNLCNTRERK